MVTIEHIQKGFTAFIDSELMPVIPDGLKKIAFATIVGLLTARVGVIIESYADNPVFKMSGISQDDGKIDIDLIHDEFVKHFPKDGTTINIPTIGPLSIKAPDIHKLHEYIINSEV